MPSRHTAIPKNLERSFLVLWLVSFPLLFLLRRSTSPPLWLQTLALSLVLLNTALAAVVLFRSFLRSYKTFSWFGRHFFEVSLLVLMPPLILRDFRWLGLMLLFQGIMLLQVLSREEHFRPIWDGLLNRPALLLVMSFGGLIAVGTMLLMLPEASTKTPHTFLEALFTATSATCVTGLVVKDTGLDFSFFGQLVILVLIQIGGLGIITFSSFVMWSMGQRLGIRSRDAISAILDEQGSSRAISLLRFIVLATVLLETVGALLLFVAWYSPQKDAWSVMYSAIFHSISAFCNAGFALDGNSLIPFQKDILVNFTIMALILLGGMGFPVLASFFDPERFRHFRRNLKQHSFLWASRLFLRALPLNTKIVLIVQTILVFGIAAIFLVLEYGHSLAKMGFFYKLQGALFQSVTLRTAGFNTVDFSLLTPATLFLMMFAMFLGGASGGTAGGIKINTIAILGLMLRSILRGEERVMIFGRSLTRGNIARATSIITIFSLIFFFFSFLLLATQDKISFPFALFEVTSAMGTVGLTTANKAGIATTALLDSFGRLCVIVLMFFGRLGPLTVAFAVTAIPAAGRYSYPEERIYVG